MGDDALARALALGHEEAELDAPERAMVDYVVKLTARPQDVRAADVERLRHAGFDDRAILDICQVAAYYAYVNRLADGLGVELEPSWGPDDLTVTREEMRARRDRAGAAP